MSARSTARTPWSKREAVSVETSGSPYTSTSLGSPDPPFGRAGATRNGIASSRTARQTEAHVFRLESVQNRRPACGKVRVARVDIGLAGGREEVELGPHAAAGKAVDHIDAKEARGLGRLLDLLGRTLAHTLRLAVAPDVVGQNAFVAFINRITDALPNEMIANRPAAEIVLFEQITLLAHVAVRLQRLIDLKMIAPAGKLQAVKTPLARLLGQRLQWQIRPLSGKKRNWSCHD